MNKKQPTRISEFDSPEEIEKFLVGKMTELGSGWEFERFMLTFLEKERLIKEHHKAVREKALLSIAENKFRAQLPPATMAWPANRKTKQGDIHRMLSEATQGEFRLAVGSYEPVYKGERVDLTQTAFPLQHYVFFRCGETLEPGALADLLFGLAEANQFDPLTEFVQSCVGTPFTKGTIETSLIKFWDIPDTPLTREACRLFWMGLVARWSNPGCRFEYLVTLFSATEGHQKTAFLRGLAPPGSGAYLPLGGADFDNKDTQMKLAGAGIVELAEGQAFRRNEVDAQKRWITETFDRFRAPYGRMHDIKTHHRRFIPVLTTNHRTVLQDNTGNRRHLFLELRAQPSTEDLAAFMKLVPSFIAEAKARLDAGEPLYIQDKELAALQSAENKVMTPIDPVERAIGDYLHENGCVKYFAFADLKEYVSNEARGYDVRFLTDKTLSNKLTDLGFERHLVNPYQLLDSAHRTVYVAPKDCFKLGIGLFVDNGISPELRFERRAALERALKANGPS